VRDEAGTLWASPPDTLAGRMEIRGLGILPVEHAPRTRVDAVVDLVAREEVVRLPEPESVALMEVYLPRFMLCAFDASAPARLALIAHLCKAGRTRT